MICSRTYICAMYACVMNILNNAHRKPRNSYSTEMSVVEGQLSYEKYSWTDTLLQLKRAIALLFVIFPQTTHETFTVHIAVLSRFYVAVHVIRLSSVHRATGVKRKAWNHGHYVNSCITMVSSIPRPFPAVDRDKPSTVRREEWRINAWHRRHFTNTMLK